MWNTKRVVLLVLAVAVLGSSGLAEAQEDTSPSLVFNPVQDSHHFRVGDSVRACVHSGFTNANDWIMTLDMFVTLEGHEDGTGNDPLKLQGALYQEMDSENCVPLVSCVDFCADPAVTGGTLGSTELGVNVGAREECAVNGIGEFQCLDPCWCVNRTARYAIAFNASGLGGQTMWTNITVGPAGANQGNLGVEGFQSFDIKVNEFLLIGLTILAFANGWIMAGAFAWVAAIATQVTNPGPLTYTLGYAGFALFIGFEVVGHKFGPIRRARRFVADKD